MAGPGTGTDAITTGSISIAVAATLLGISSCVSSTDPADEPIAGTGFTSRAFASNGVIGAFALVSKAVSADAAATWSAPNGAANFVSAAIAIANPGAPGGAGSFFLSNAGPGGMVSMSGGMRG